MPTVESWDVAQVMDKPKPRRRMAEEATRERGQGEASSKRRRVGNVHQVPTGDAEDAELEAAGGIEEEQQQGDVMKGEGDRPD